MSENEVKPQKKSAQAGKSGGKRNAPGASTNAIDVDPSSPKVSPSKPPRLSVHYRQKVVPHLLKELSFKNPMEVPSITKIVVSSCLKEATTNPKALEFAAEEIALITGQKPRINKSKKSIAAFKLRQGVAIGASVTLRRARMYEFLDRLISIALPRVRDFKGLNSKSFDGRGNYSLGIKEQIIFPEINYDRVDKIRGLNITIVTTAKNNDHARVLLAEIGLPFRKA